MVRIWKACLFAQKSADQVGHSSRLPPQLPPIPSPARALYSRLYVYLLPLAVLTATRRYVSATVTGRPNDAPCAGSSGKVHPSVRQLRLSLRMVDLLTLHTDRNNHVLAQGCTCHQRSRAAYMTFDCDAWSQILLSKPDSIIPQRKGQAVRALCSLTGEPTFARMPPFRSRQIVSIILSRRIPPAPSCTNPDATCRPTGFGARLELP